MTEDGLKILDGIVRMILFAETVIYIFLIVSMFRRRKANMKKLDRFFQESIEREKEREKMIELAMEDLKRGFCIIPQESVIVQQESVIVQQEREIEKPYGRIIQLAFYAKKKRIRKKNLKRMGEYGRNQKRQISGNR